MRTYVYDGLYINEEYPFDIDYRLTLEEMVLAGEYDEVAQKITIERFPIEGEGLVDVKLVLVRFDHCTITEDVIAHLKAQGLEPARIEHLLAFGALYQNVQRMYAVVAPGSVRISRAGHCDEIPALIGGHSERELCSWPDYGPVEPWDEETIFLALRERSA